MTKIHPTPTAKEMAETHWLYVASVLYAHGETEDVIAKCKHHYVTAWIHADKHARERFGSEWPGHNVGMGKGILHEPID